MKIVSLFVILCVVYDTGTSISSKMDFGEETYSVTNSTVVDSDEDLEVKHVITVETSLKNGNNRRGLHGPYTDFQRKGSPKHKKEKKDDDSDEVPIVLGWKGVDSTAIRTPDRRLKAPPESVFINRNIRDEYDFYPNVGYSNPSQWVPSVYFNNINWWNQQMKEPSFESRIDRGGLHSTVNINNKLASDTMKEFYCKRCAELNGMKSCTQRKISTTTPKMKIDGKLAKLH